MNNVQHTDNLLHDLKKESLFTLITVKVNNTEKTLFKFELKKTGDVLMYCKPAEFYRDPGELATSEKKIKQQRYSFHKSSESKDVINFIKQTIDLDIGEIKNTYIVTPAIKNKSGFIHVLSRRAPDLSTEKYNTKKKSKYRLLNLGDFDCKSSTLFYSLFVSSSTISVPNKITIVNALSFVVGDFKFLVIWGYLPLPSHFTGSLIHSTTIKNDTGEILGQVDGVNAMGAIKLNEHYFKTLIDEYDKTLNPNKTAPFNLVKKIFELTGFLKSGKQSSAEKERGQYK
ncbi:hypothetical protein WJE63_004448 [Klebsiella pneumoniae]